MLGGFSLDPYRAAVSLLPLDLEPMRLGICRDVVPLRPGFFLKGRKGKTDDFIQAGNLSGEPSGDPVFDVDGRVKCPPFPRRVLKGRSRKARWPVGGRLVDEQACEVFEVLHGGDKAD